MIAEIPLQVKTAMTPRPSFTPVRNGLLQRKCACGGTPGPTGECEACRKKKLQRRPRNLPAPSSINHQPSTASEVPPIVHDVLRSPGQPLDEETRTFMERRFGHDFSHVRVHADSRAGFSTRAVNALAYTVGHNIVFQPDFYKPESAEGKRLLAHELTHVLQQGGGTARVQRADSETGKPIEAMSVGRPMLSRIDPPYPGVIGRCRAMGVPCPAPHFHHGTVCRLVSCSRAATANLPFAISPGVCIYQCLDGQVCSCVLLGSATSAICVLTLCDRAAQAANEPDYESLVARAVAAAQQQFGNRSGSPADDRRQSTAIMQSKLEVGGSGDIYEQEAEAVADKVMRMPAPTLQQTCAPCAAGGPPCPKCQDEGKGLVQRKAEPTSGTASISDGFLHDLGSGPPLDPAARAFFEPRFRHNFSRVRVHTDAKSAESARAVNALAYTVGWDVVFGGGQYSPQGGSGRHLLAHELAHVVQQTGDAGLRNQQGGQPVGHTSPGTGASPSESHDRPTASPTPVQHHSTGLRLSRQNARQATNVLSRGAVASVQLIVGGTMNSTRVGPVSQREDVSVIIGRLTTIRSLAEQLLPLWNTATPFTAPGGAAPIAFAPLTVDELAKGLLVFNRYRLAIPPAAIPPVMTNWKIGMRFPLPIRIDAATNEGVLHPDPIRSMAGTFDAAWAPLLDALPAVLPAQTGASLQQSVADFLTAQPTTLARGIHLGARAVANAQDSREFILEVFNQVRAGAFELALAFMDYVVNQDIGVLASQTAGAAILARIRMLLAAPPAGVTPAQQSSLNRANLMLGIVAGVHPLPDPCVPNRKLTWANFAGAVPAGAPANREAETRFDIYQVAFQGNQLFQAVFDPASWVRPRSGQPGNLAVNGCQPQINACEAFFNGVPAGAVGAHWDLPGGPAPACPATILPGALRANNFGDCANLIGTACTRARQADSQTRLLPHEQLHFDIPCVLVHKANAARARGSAVTLAAVRTRTNALTGQYDSQTNHGCLAAPQARWESDVAAGLPAQTFP